MAYLWHTACLLNAFLDTAKSTHDLVGTKGTVVTKVIGLVTTGGNLLKKLILFMPSMIMITSKYLGFDD